MVMIKCYGENTKKGRSEGETANLTMGAGRSPDKLNERSEGRRH